MLYKEDQYNIAMGTLLTYKNDLDKPLTSASGISKVFDATMNWERYSSFSRSKFILVCVFLVSKYNITNIADMVKYLNDKSWKDAYEDFINSIRYYEIFMGKDFDFFSKIPAVENELETLLQKYIKEEIKFYSIYFLIKHFKKDSYFEKHRIYKQYWRKLKFLMKYFSFEKGVIDKNLSKLKFL